MVIYIDVLLFLNLLIDYLLLSGVSRLLHEPTAKRRLIVGAAIGAASSLVILLPPLPLIVSAAIKLLFAALMVRAAFRYRGFRRFLRQTALLFLIGALFAGICMLLYLLLPSGILVQSGVVYYDIPPLLLILLTVAAYGGLTLFDRLTERRVAAGCAYRLSLTSGGDSVTLRCMLDTGLHLLESFSGAPVILADRAAIAPVCPALLHHSLDAPAPSIRYIPFSSVGGNGLLPAFRPTHATLSGGGKTTPIDGVWIAVTDTLGRGEYDALIGPPVISLLCP
ncbi:MAG: sigma-E processing peptidase SpoIIGA [Clostridia bacterium]|nr:sigma-E processing peptidase SpoIIGA [Clostridia bacterium]